MIVPGSLISIFVEVSAVDNWLKDNLVCPRDHESLVNRGDTLVCPRGHGYPLIDGIPVMLLDDVEPTHPLTSRHLDPALEKGSYLEEDEEIIHVCDIDPFVQKVVASTCGHLYESLIDNLREYPIPELRLADGDGKLLLDIGCNWGRWTIAAARKNYTAVGIDPLFQSVRAARRVARKLGLKITYLAADSRFLPFRPALFDVAFSYSVIQHMSRENARASLGEISRVLKPSGSSLIQMPNVYGVRNIYNQIGMKFRDPGIFHVRYYTPTELEKTFTESVGPTTLTVDGFFSLNAQASDLRLLPLKSRAVVRTSEALRKLSRKMKFMVNFADSLYVHSTKR
jgi:2-polyprenyl-3-methyl-5-hydroxy-6-metoxy-1,4-benzoquinol methylase/uncharacterized protein YbaR (Trm112 family)